MATNSDTSRDIEMCAMVKHGPQTPLQKESLNTCPIQAWVMKQDKQKYILGGESNNESVWPIGSMYGIFTYIWLMFIVNVGKYTLHGSYGKCR